MARTTLSVMKITANIAPMVMIGDGAPVLMTRAPLTKPTSKSPPPQRGEVLQPEVGKFG